MGGFFSALFGGQNKTLNKDINQMGNLAGFSTGVGEGDTTAASTYWKNILSGDPNDTAKSLAPEISAGQTTAAEEKNSLAQFGTRSGGTAAAAAGIDEQTRAHIINLLGGLRSGAASSLGSLGTANLQLAQNATTNEADLSQQRMQNWLSSIFGQAISSGVSSAEGFGLGKLFPAAKAAKG